MSAIASASNVVTLTAGAVGEVKSLLTLPENAGKHMRFYVEQGGCSGMQYGMIFDEKREGDLVAEDDGVTVLVDPISADYLRGTVVDFSDALTGGGFKMIIEDRSGAGYRPLEDVALRMMGAANQAPGLRSVFTTYSTRTPRLPSRATASTTRT